MKNDVFVLPMHIPTQRHGIFFTGDEVSGIFNNLIEYEKIK